MTITRTPWEVAADILDPPEDPNAWVPLPHQVPPLDPWFLWLMMGGRGTGKTDAGAAWTDAHMLGPACDDRLPGGHRMSIIAPTLGDAYESCVMGPSGLKAHNPAITTVTRKGGTYAHWPNGAELRLFGAYTPEDVERLRSGGNRCAVWCEELAAWRQLRKAWNHMRFGLRLGAHPKVIATTTPKPRKHIIRLVADPRTTTTSAKTIDNPHLAQEVRDALVEEYGGTRLGRQELDGEMLTDVPGAVATVDQLETCRRDSHPTLSKRIVMIDPSQTNTEESDDSGITVQGRRDNHVYLLADLTQKADVSDWADAAVAAGVEWECGEIWYESTGGSDTYAEVLKEAVNRYNERLRLEWEAEYADVSKIQRPTCPRVQFAIKGVPARLSKRDRAVALEMAIQQDRWHPVGVFKKLEEQLTTWTEVAGDDDESDKKAQKDKSPNNMDAAVHGYRVLMGLAMGKGKTSGKQIAAARMG